MPLFTSGGLGLKNLVLFTSLMLICRPGYDVQQLQSRIVILRMRRLEQNDSNSWPPTRFRSKNWFKHI